MKLYELRQEEKVMEHILRKIHNYLWSENILLTSENYQKNQSLNF